MHAPRQYLDPDQRAAAPCLFRALEAARVEHTAAIGRDPSGTVDAQVLIQTAKDALRTQPLFEVVEYVTISNADTFAELTSVGSDGAVLSAAVKIGNTRLLDNVILNKLV